MERRTVLLGSVTALAAGMSWSTAEAQDAKAGVQKAIEAFEAALSSLDVNKMMALWAQGSAIVLLNPRDKEAAIGSEAVKKNWQETMGGWESLKVSSKGPSTIHVNGSAAYRFTPEGVAGKFKSGKESGLCRAGNYKL
jgi:ketosteroid isomerase-like protein